MTRGASLFCAATLLAAIPARGFAEEQKPAAVAQAEAQPAAPSSAAPATQPAPAAEPQPAAPPAAPAVTPPPPKKEEKKFTATPYGFVLFNFFWNTGAFAAQDFIGFATAPGAAAGPSFIGDARQSRIGVRLGLPDALGAEIKGVVEADFKAGFLPNGNVTAAGTTAGSTVTAVAPSQNIEWYRPIPRLRLGNITALWKAPGASVGLEFGQDYGLVNPVFGVTLAWTADPVFYQAGNIWRRSPQARVFGELGGDLALTWAGAILMPIDQGEGQPDLGPGDRSRKPDVEGRVSALMRSGKSTVAEVGVSGHWGKERYILAGNYDKEITNWVGGVDALFNIPAPGLTPNFLGLRGEAYAGENLDDYNANFGVGVRRFTTAGELTNVASIYTRGFWAQAILSPLPQMDGVDPLQLTFGVGIEQPHYKDLPNPSATVAGNQVRTKNRQVAGGVILNASKNLKFGFEVGQTTTDAKVTPTPASAAFVNRQFKAVQLAFSTQLLF